MLEEKFAVKLAPPSIYHLLKRCRLSWISARAKHPKANKIEQEECKKNVSLNPVEIWFQDEARVGQKGTRPRVVRQQQFTYAYIFGAVCPQKDLGVALVMPSVGTLCMQEHLEEISKCIDQEKHGWIVLDRATGHTTKKIKLPHNISLLPLPPASPE